MRLAEIIAAFALCLDLSTLSSIASGQFATAHEKLGRNSPTHGLKLENLNDDFFKTVLWDKGELIGYTPTHVCFLFVVEYMLFLVHCCRQPTVIYVLCTKIHVQIKHFSALNWFVHSD